MNLRGLAGVLSDAGKSFSEDKVPKLSGSLAYTIVFSLGPLMIVIISLCGLFLGREAVEGKIQQQLSSFIGSQSAADLQQVIQHASLSGKSKLAAIVGSVFLLIGATAVFAEIQDSINSIWGIKPKPQKGWLRILKNRFLSFSVIISLGFLLLVSLGVSTVIDEFSRQLQARYPDVTVALFYVINLLISFIVTAAIFAVIFKVLPDATIRWKDVIAGAIATAIFFLLGKFAISLYISKTDVGATYGAAGSIVVLLVWVYYSSFILYFGAEFTRYYALKFGSEIRPSHYAVTTKIIEVEEGRKPLEEDKKKQVST